MSSKFAWNLPTSKPIGPYIANSGSIIHTPESSIMMLPVVCVSVCACMDGCACRVCVTCVVYL